MEKLCLNYWYPLYVFARRKGNQHEDACDLTQAFFAKFLEKHYLRSVDASLGKFRTFLLASMSHFLTNEWHKSEAQRRGGGVTMFSLDDAAADRRYQLEPLDHASPEKIFDRRWAETILGVVIDKLAAETEEERFEVLKGFLLDDKGSVSYGVAAGRLGISVAATTSAIHRMRDRYRKLLFEEVANTLDKPEDVQEELHYLLSALSD